MKHRIEACEMTHNFGPFETWRIGDTERVKANFGCPKSLSRSVYADNLDDALQDVYGR